MKEDEGRIDPANRPHTGPATGGAPGPGGRITGGAPGTEPRAPCLGLVRLGVALGLSLAQGAPLQGPESPSPVWDKDFEIHHRRA